MTKRKMVVLIKNCDLELLKRISETIREYNKWKNSPWSSGERLSNDKQKKK